MRYAVLTRFTPTYKRRDIEASLLTVLCRRHTVFGLLRQTLTPVIRIIEIVEIMGHRTHRWAR